MTAMEAAPYAASQAGLAAHALLRRNVPHVGAMGIADLLVPGGDHTRDRIKRAQWQAAREAAREVIDARSPIRTDSEGIITRTAETRRDH